MKSKMKETFDIIGSLIFLLMILVATLGAYIQHFITTVSEDMWVLMTVGAILPPVGILHGWLVWSNVL